MKNTITELVRERSRFIKVPVIVGSLVIGAGVLATYAFSDYLTQRSSDEFQTRTNEQATIFSNTIKSRSSEFEQILLTLSAYQITQPNLPRQQWNQFISQSKVLDRHPYITGVGQVDVVRRDNLPQYVESQQGELPGLAIFPSGDREMYTPVKYRAPDDATNKKSIGYDMFSEPLRRATMIKARDQGMPAMTPPLQLLQDSGDKTKIGVIMYYPIYSSGTIPETVEERRAQNTGFSFIGFRPSDFIANVDSANPEQLMSSSYSINDASTGVSMTSKISNTSASDTKYTQTQTTDIIDRQWMIMLTSYQPALQRWTAPGVTFLLGIATSFAVGALITYLMARRLVRLDVQHQSELQRTKDELLALTSHQLRTPASGVKQYVGMLLQGFVGELTPQQEVIAKKAFAANERQLETINQLLHVAKADADQLVLQKEPINLIEFVTQIVDEMQDTASEHGSEIQIKSPKRDVIVLADERYLRMAIENLISNALKYSESGRPVKITIAARKELVLLAVRDYGVGISEEDIQKLFKKFTRIPNSLSRSVGGSGLGLFLAEQIMIAHDGDIEVDSKVGKGSIFTITMPTYVHENISTEKEQK
jgi:signal transduction histidine kinase